MSDHDTITPEIDDELRARLRTFVEDVKERTDTEAALERMPRRSRPPTIWLVAVAACLILIVAIAAVEVADRQSVDTVPPAESPTTTAADGTRTLARGVVRFVGSPVGVCRITRSPSGPEFDQYEQGRCLAGQTLDITAVEENGDVTGEARFNGIVVELECLDARAPAGVVALGGRVTESSGDGAPSVGSLIAVIIREGEPDSAEVWPDEHDSCPELFRSIPAPWSDFLEDFVDVVDGDDIETG